MSVTEALRCKSLVLDAGPLLSLSPLRGLAETYITVPQVLAELKDKRARDHFEQLGLMSGVNVKVQSPDAASLAHVVRWAKKTGDYSVLSHPDLCVLAMTYALHEAAQKTKQNTGIQKLVQHEKNEPQIESSLGNLSLDPSVSAEHELEIEGGSAHASIDQSPAGRGESLDEQLQQHENPGASPSTLTSLSGIDFEPIFDDPSDSDDGEGEWITPSNVKQHKYHLLDMLPGSDPGRKEKVDEVIDTGCMTADFAMQNILLQMGLNLVSVEGKRIEKIKSWVLRCHACFKICKDNSKKFCPSCGNPTLLRASVTISSPSVASDTPAMQVHLKPNFQYRIRGTKYPIPAPKAGSAKTGAGNNLILREDQLEYLRAKKRADGKREREEVKMLNGILGQDVGSAKSVGSWTDPDWVPEIMATGINGKGRTMRSRKMDGDMPQIGYGKGNPNVVKRHK